MDRVFANGFRELGADGAGGRVCGVGCAHDFAVLCNGAFAFQNLNNDRSRRHEFAQFVIERTLGVHFVELASLLFGHVDALLRDDAQAGLFELGIDFASQVAAG